MKLSTYGKAISIYLLRSVCVYERPCMDSCVSVCARVWTNGDGWLQPEAQTDLINGVNDHER